MLPCAGIVAAGPRILNLLYLFQSLNVNANVAAGPRILNLLYNPDAMGFVQLVAAGPRILNLLYPYGWWMEVGKLRLDLGF